MLVRRNGPAGAAAPAGDRPVRPAAGGPHEGDTGAGEPTDLGTGNPGWESA
ncbi:hypothetical protein [Streptoalloteichus hindustanus]|uniref:hypothetical protein n=1 Tax=Streptoalloteichus hindustanus TaxID=2017 RepID=UPI0013566D51|nr:hypothetical protein [Streptoalloteichus hindustanus]